VWGKGIWQRHLALAFGRDLAEAFGKGIWHLAFGKGIWQKHSFGKEAKALGKEAKAFGKGGNRHLAKRQEHLVKEETGVMCDAVRGGILPAHARTRTRC